MDDSIKELLKLSYQGNINDAGTIDKFKNKLRRYDSTIQKLCNLIVKAENLSEKIINQIKNGTVN